VGGVRRQRYYRVDQLESVAAVLTHHQPTAVVFDIEHCLTGRDPAPDELRRSFSAAQRLVDGVAEACQVWFVSNGAIAAADDLSSAELDAVQLIRRAKKPRTALALDWSSVVVVGDQILTDGRLAARNGAVYVQLRYGRPRGALSRLNRLIGEYIVGPVRFVTTPLPMARTPATPLRPVDSARPS
jgi:predicted HAD superfamily phosphohydrolase YqeG